MGSMVGPVLSSVLEEVLTEVTTSIRSRRGLQSLAGGQWQKSGLVQVGKEWAIEKRSWVTWARNISLRM